MTGWDPHDESDPVTPDDKSTWREFGWEIRDELERFRNAILIGIAALVIFVALMIGRFPWPL